MSNEVFGKYTMKYHYHKPIIKQDMKNKIELILGIIGLILLILATFSKQIQMWIVNP